MTEGVTDISLFGKHQVPSGRDGLEGLQDHLEDIVEKMQEERFT